MPATHRLKNIKVEALEYTGPEQIDALYAFGLNVYLVESGEVMMNSLDGERLLAPGNILVKAVSPVFAYCTVTMAMTAEEFANEFEALP